MLRCQKHTKISNYRTEIITNIHRFHTTKRLIEIKFKFIHRILTYILEALRRTTI